jgi:hypothetical protein
MFVRQKRIGRYVYVHLVETVREDGHIKQRIIGNLGRKEDVERRGDLDRLVRSLARLALNDPDSDGRMQRAGSQLQASVEEQVVPAEVLLGTRFKGYQDFVVQGLVLRGLVLRVRAIRYRRERCVTPGGRTVIAPLPPGVTTTSGRSCAASCWRNTPKGRSRCHGW